MRIPRWVPFLGVAAVLLRYLKPTGPNPAAARRKLVKSPGYAGVQEMYHAACEEADPGTPYISRICGPNSQNTENNAPERVRGERTSGSLA